MSMEAIPLQLTIENLRAGYLRGSFTPREVIETIVQRAKRDQEMNIWILPPAMDRITPFLERLEQLSIEECPLWGIPFAIKDNIDVAGWPVTAGCPEYEYVPESHAAVVVRLLAAGAVPVGKSNLDQFATGLVGTRSPYGETHNALRPELISGGSSSGSAVAVACGHAAFALGTDTAGSGRVPAALHGLVGYKPAVGAWPSAGLIPACRSIDCITVFSHTVEDSVLVDSSVRGYLPGDPYSLDRPIVSTPLTQPTYLLPQGPLTFYGPYASQYAEAWEEVRQKLVNSGSRIKEVDIELFQEAAALLYEGPLVAERWSDLQAFIDEHPGAAFPVTEKILRSGGKADHTAASLYRAQHRLTELRSMTRELMRDAVLVLPTCGGTWTRDQVREDPIFTNSQMGLYTNHCNLLDLSAIAVPAGEAGEKLPFGITIFALPEQEELMAKAARFWLQQEDRITVAVCGLHMRGMPLEKQMTGLGATFIEETVTAPKYQLYKLPTTPAKPGLVRVEQEGATITLELWRMAAAAFGRFTASIPAPLGIGTIELMDGREVSGFVCESYAVKDAENITAVGSWRNALTHVEAVR